MKQRAFAMQRAFRYAWDRDRGEKKMSDNRSREARVATLERERNVLQLYIRGLTWLEIARQLGLGAESSAQSVFKRVLRRIPPADIDTMRKLEGERITDMRRRIWSELAGRQEQVPDPDNPGQKKTVTIRPEPEQVMEMLRTAVRVGRHEAAIFGYEAPVKADINALFPAAAQPITDEEAAVRWARLTPEEQDTWIAWRRRWRAAGSIRPSRRSRRRCLRRPTSRTDLRRKN